MQRKKKENRTIKFIYFILFIVENRRFLFPSFARNSFRNSNSRYILFITTGKIFRSSDLEEKGSEFDEIGNELEAFPLSSVSSIRYDFRFRWRIYARAKETVIFNLVRLEPDKNSEANFESQRFPR